MKSWLPAAALALLVALLLVATVPAYAQPAAPTPSVDGDTAELMARQARRPDQRPRAVRIARRLVRAAVTDKARRGEAYRAIFDADRRYSVDLREALGAPVVRPSWRHQRWMRDALTSRNPTVRQLMRRTFADQHEPDEVVGPRLVPAANVLITQRRAALNRANARWLQGVLARIGWFRIRQYGAEASQAAWLLVQHADFDPAWQRRVAATLRPLVDSGDMQASYYGYLTDRIAVNAHEAQTFGTQGRCVGPGVWQPFASVDPTQLDARRRSIGLEPIAAYRARFTCG